MSQTRLSSHHKVLTPDRACPFPVGVEYFRGPSPPKEFWDEDFARIRAAGMRIVRTFTPWNWIETAPGVFQFDDFDLMFELAAKHDLKVWLDTPVGTHMACPEWITRKHPDMRAVWRDGSVQQPTAGDFAPHGVMIHNFDHPMWRIYVEQYITALVNRYKDHPAMHIWGTWDGINLAAAWARELTQAPGIYAGGRPYDGYPPYNDYTIEKYIHWLKERFTLDKLNEHLMRRYLSWDDVDAPRSNDAIADMLLYRRFHYENMANQLGWLADLIDRLDGKHEQRSHGGSFPRCWDEIAAERIDGWGMSHHTSERLDCDDPYKIANECISHKWSRSIGRNGRWWQEEIYSSFVGGLSNGEKMALPQELTMFMWLTLIEGAAGAMFWQYRPEYMTFEGPGLNLVSLDGQPTQRLTAIQKTIAQINSIAEHLPLGFSQSPLAMVYSPLSAEIFKYNNEEKTYRENFQGTHQTLWANNIPLDIISPSMDFSRYKALCLPNMAALDDRAIQRLRHILQSDTGPAIIALGQFATFAGKGHWSFRPPEGLDDLLNVRVVDFNRITERDIRDRNNIIHTDQGDFPLTTPCRYLILEPGDGPAAPDGAKTVATLNGDVVGVEIPNRRFTWWSWFPAEGFDNVTPPELLLPHLNSLGVTSDFTIRPDRLIAFRRLSKLGGSLVFLLNLEPTPAQTTVKPNWPLGETTDLLENKTIPTTDNAFEIKIAPRSIKVLHIKGTN